MNKICIYFESYLVGGLDTFTYQLINNWDNRDQLVLLCNKSHSGAKFFKDKITNPNCKVELYSMSMVSDWEVNIANRHLARLVHILSYLLHVPYYVLCGYRILKLSRFTHLYVINGGYPACTSSRCIAISWWLYTGKKSLHNFHNLAVKSHFPNMIIDSVIDNLLIKATSYFVSVSKVSAESLRVRNAFKFLENITYIYNGTSDNIVKPSFSLKTKLNLDEKSRILMMLATYEERKGHKFIIDVLDKIVAVMSDVHVVFVGYGTEEDVQNVEAYAKNKHLEQYVHCLGYTTNAMEYLAQTDLVLIGSQGFESFGLTSVEAMKYHKVVLSTNVGGLKEVIKDGFGGFLFAQNDAAGMASKVVELLGNETMMEEQENLGFQRYKEYFTAKRVSDDYRKLLLSSC